MNDCKIRGRSLERVVEEFGHPTFVFKSYSFAQSYPIAYEAEDPADLQLLTRDAYLDDFCGRVRDLRPRYGVPFGSMVAFLHPENRDLNQFLITPARSRGVRRDRRPVTPPRSSRWRRATRGTPPTGSRCSTSTGTPTAKRTSSELAASIQPKLDAQAAAEAGRTLSWAAFHDYFTRFVRGLPPLTGRFVCKRPLVFEVPSSPEPYWVVDVRHRRVYRGLDAAGRPGEPRPGAGGGHGGGDPRTGSRRSCTAAMRIRVDLRAGGVSDDLAFWGLVAVWELGYLKPTTWLRPRFWQVHVAPPRRDPLRARRDPRPRLVLRPHGQPLRRIPRVSDRVQKQGGSGVVEDHDRAGVARDPDPVRRGVVGDADGVGRSDGLQDVHVGRRRAW